MFIIHKRPFFQIGHLHQSNAVKFRCSDILQINRQEVQFCDEYNRPKYFFVYNSYKSETLVICANFSTLIILMKKMFVVNNNYRILLQLQSNLKKRIFLESENSNTEIINKGREKKKRKKNDLFVKN